MSNNKHVNNKKTYVPDQKRVDKEYYEGLYNDLPKEVVNILMETHPLMGHNQDDPEATAYRTRRPETEEVDAIRASRMQQVGKEIAQETEEEPRQEQRRQELPQENWQDEQPRGATYYYEQEPQQPSQMKEEPYHEESKPELQYVQMNVTKRQEKVEAPTGARKKKKSKQSQEQLYFGENDVDNKKYNFEDFDWDAKEKEENLDQLYGDDYEDKDRVALPGKRVVIAGIVAILIIGACGFSIISLKNKLGKAEKQIQAQTELSDKYEELQLQKRALEDEIKVLKGIDTPTEQGGAAQSGDGTSTPAASGEYEIYTATESDTYWSMAAKYYGNGADYQQILDANGLTEANPVKPGQQYKIPKKE